MKQSLNKRVDNLLARSSPNNESRKTSDERMLHLMHHLCKNYGWDYYTLIKQPISFIWVLVEGMISESKEFEDKSGKQGFGKKGFGNKVGR